MDGTRRRIGKILENAWTKGRGYQMKMHDQIHQYHLMMLLSKLNASATAGRMYQFMTYKMKMPKRAGAPTFSMSENGHITGWSMSYDAFGR